MKFIIPYLEMSILVMIIDEKSNLATHSKISVCREQIRQFYNKTALEHLCVREKSSVGGYMT